jgi:ABC-type branched-subunit amino acid transport system permease subunit
MTAAPPLLAAALGAALGAIRDDGFRRAHLAALIAAFRAQAAGLPWTLLPSSTPIQPLVIGGWEVPLFRTGFRMVVFSVLLMVVVLFYRRGIMGTNEFSWEGIRNIPALIKKKFGKSPAGGDAK